MPEMTAELSLCLAVGCGDFMVVADYWLGVSGLWCGVAVRVCEVLGRCRTLQVVAAHHSPALAAAPGHALQAWR